ncbi:MAG: twin-arginine translocase TatA/TatE family subunit [Acidimicrobiales bacterium]
MLTGEIFGPDLLVVVVIVAVVIFGGAAIPKLARSLGQAKSEFAAGLKTPTRIAESLDQAARSTSAPPRTDG